MPFYLFQIGANSTSTLLIKLNVVVPLNKLWHSPWSLLWGKCLILIWGMMIDLEAGAVTPAGGKVFYNVFCILHVL